MSLIHFKISYNEYFNPLLWIYKSLQWRTYYVFRDHVERVSTDLQITQMKLRKREIISEKMKRSPDDTFLISQRFCQSEGNIYSILIDEDLSESLNVSIKFPCTPLTYLCLSSEDLFIIFCKGFPLLFIWYD